MNWSTDSEPGSVQTLGLFERGGRVIGLDVEFVQEVLVKIRVTRVPKTPSHVGGVLNLRGSIIPVALVDRLLGLPPNPIDPAKPIVVARLRDFVVGIQFDAVRRVISVPRSEILPNPLSTSAAHFSGIWSRPDHPLVTIVDGVMFLSSLRRMPAAMI